MRTCTPQHAANCMHPRSPASAGREGTEQVQSTNNASLLPCSPPSTPPSWSFPFPAKQAGRERERGRRYPSGYSSRGERRSLLPSLLLPQHVVLCRLGSCHSSFVLTLSCALHCLLVFLSPFPHLVLSSHVVLLSLLLCLFSVFLYFSHAFSPNPPHPPAPLILRSDPVRLAPCPDSILAFCLWRTRGARCDRNNTFLPLTCMRHAVCMKNNTEIQNHRITEIQKYRNTEIQKYRNTEIQKYRNTITQ